MLRTLVILIHLKSDLTKVLHGIVLLNSLMLFLEVFKEIIEITDRIIVIPFPAKEKIKDLAKYFNTKYAHNYLIYNLSEHKYDTSPFKNQVSSSILNFLNQVIEYSFAGYPCAPLEILFLILKEIESWLTLDPKNVAVLHCQASHVKLIFFSFI
jgi:hypothetical protein